MRYLSVCSGIEAASVAWHPLGWEAAALAEIEAFPSAVLSARWPDTPNLGDMTKFYEWPERCGCIAPKLGSPRSINLGDITLRIHVCTKCGGIAIDLLVGGTPCQSFSVAGLRKGLADPRGNLALTFLAIAARYRPRWVLWENVPGVLSDKTGGFAALLGGLGHLGYGWAYRILDAQFFGLAQRRRRVFVVGHLGDWRRAAAVLFERASLRGDAAPSGCSQNRVAEGTVPCLDASFARLQGCSGQDAKHGHRHLVVMYGGNNRSGPIAVSPGLSATGGRFDFASEGFVVDQARRVRKTTPLEWERLQGFPDDYTLVSYRGKPAADGPRYKALGNSFAVPVVRWIGQRIQMVADMDLKGGLHEP
jgi:DNA (cytosine-5)-methyltransferase 1